MATEGDKLSPFDGHASATHRAALGRLAGEELIEQAPPIGPRMMSDHGAACRLSLPAAMG